MSQSSFPAVREVTIHSSRLRKPTRAKHICLEALDSTLALPQLAGVRCLIVEYNVGADTVYSHKAEVSSRLPLSCGLGVVAICPCKLEAADVAPEIGRDEVKV